MNVSVDSTFLGSLPSGFSGLEAGSIWAHYSSEKTAALPGEFNRTRELQSSGSSQATSVADTAFSVQCPMGIECDQPVVARSQRLPQFLQLRGL